ncbi:MAG: peptide deformylase [Paracoccaceae bacterium]
MTSRAVVMWPDPVLRQVCAPVAVFGSALKDLADEMLQAMYDAAGRGLAAPQIGVLDRVFVVDVTWKEGVRAPKIFVNPEIKSQSDQMSVNTEQCLSIPDTPRNVARPEQLELTWQDLDGTLQQGSFEGFTAICIQHELDHLNGRVILDHPEAAL